MKPPNLDITWRVGNQAMKGQRWFDRYTFDASRTADSRSSRSIARVKYFLRENWWLPLFQHALNPPHLPPFPSLPPLPTPISSAPFLLPCPRWTTWLLWVFRLSYSIPPQLELFLPSSASTQGLITLVKQIFLQIWCVIHLYHNWYRITHLRNE